MDTRNYKIFFLCCLIGACVNKAPLNSRRQTGDTTAVIELALRTAFIKSRLPNIDALKKPYHHGDSILFTSAKNLLALLPRSVDTLKFAVLTPQQIMEPVLRESDSRRFPNYLNLETFEKTLSGYYVSLRNQSTGFGGGGQIGIYIEKRDDSLTVIKTQSSNIN